MIFRTLLLLFFLLGGCTTPPTKSALMPHEPIGIYHEVQKGDTLWGISKKYQVGVQELIAANRIPDASVLSVGQLLYIPPKNKQNLRD
ncbi:MAG: LysM domain-containing protein [Candidatus Omnitrophota bacterium]